MLWIREEEVFPGSDYGAFAQRCRELDLNSVCSDVRREDPEAPPPLFCHRLCLVLCLEMANALLEVLRTILQLEMDDSLVAA
jgi:hypothetical protein